jgi:hypothetical protein
MVLYYNSTQQLWLFIGGNKVQSILPAELQGQLLPMLGVGLSSGRCAVGPYYCGVGRLQVPLRHVAEQQGCHLFCEYHGMSLTGWKSIDSKIGFAW